MRALVEDNQSHLKSLVTSISKLKLESKNLTFVTSNAFVSPGRLKKPQLLIVFVMGGISTRELEDLNTLKNLDLDVIAGGSHLLNTRM